MESQLESAKAAFQEHKQWEVLGWTAEKRIEIRIVDALFELTESELSEFKKFADPFQVGD